MNERVIEVYKHYKSLYGSMLLLFRVRNNYEAYFDDAKSISTMLNIPLRTEGNICIPVSDVLDIISELSGDGAEFKLIQQRNNDGEFDLPDIKLMAEEKIMDF